MAEEAGGAGESALCSKCGTSVKQKSMIPVLGDEGAPAHVCVDCARAFVPDDYEPPGTAPDR